MDKIGQLREYSSQDLENALRPRETQNLTALREAILEVALEELKASRPYRAREFLERARELARKANAKQSLDTTLSTSNLMSVRSEIIYDELARRSALERRALWELSEHQYWPEDYSPFGVYGEDSRIDVKDVNDPAVQSFRYSTVLVTTRSSLILNADQTYSLRTLPLHNTFDPPLCSGQRFYNQPSLIGWRCSGVFVGGDLVATAGHCVSRFAAQDIRCVSGFEMIDNNNARVQFNPNDICSGVEVVASKVTSTEDWALLRINRFRGSTAVRRVGQVADNARLLVLGHPSGLPLKAAYGVVTNNSYTHSFGTDLDTFGGNSGSLVISYDNGRFWGEGLLVRGQLDYIEENNCTKVNVCPPSCTGSEEVQRFADFEALIPV